MKFSALIALFFAASGMVGYAAGVNFPVTPARICSSPDLQWRIRCETGEQSNGGALHTLFLSKLGEAKEVSIWASGRRCDALWSADSQRIALTDWAGSNVAGIFLVQVAAPSKAVKLEVKNIQVIAQKVELRGHCYYEAMKWEGAHQLLIRVFGHTDENRGHGFTYYLSVDTASGLAKLVKKFDEEGVLLTAGLLKYQRL